MKIELVKKNGVFVPAFNKDYDLAKKIAEGEIRTFKTVKVRNPKLHRKYFALLAMVFENQDLYNNKEQLRHALQTEAGYSEPTPFLIKTPQQKLKALKWLYNQIERVESGEPMIMPTPKSIAFESMGEDDFKELYEAVMLVACDFLGVDAADVVEYLRENI